MHLAAAVAVAPLGKAPLNNARRPLARHVLYRTVLHCGLCRCEQESAGGAKSGFWVRTELNEPKLAVRNAASPTCCAMRRPNQALAGFAGVAALLLISNGSVAPTQFVQYRPSASEIWSTASDAVASTANALGLGDTQNQVSEDATKSALEAFQALAKTNFGGAKTPAAAAAVSAPAATAGAAAAGTGECLITKWSAVWVVHKDRTRSHVGFPTTGCDSRADTVDDLNAYAKAHGGAGDYFLDEAKSKAACQLYACGASGAAAAAAASTSATSLSNGGGGSRSSSSSSSMSKALHPMVPLLGWGVGVSSGGAWMARTSLRFNKPAQQSFPQLELGPGEPLLLVFGGASVTEMLKNWVLHVKRVHGGLGMPFVVACMDEKLFNLAEQQGYPAVS